MGVGMNFVCSCCGYDSGMLMLNQGSHDSIHQVIRKYIHMYTQEIDLCMHPSREKIYQHILQQLTHSEKETSYHYDGCVCYSCKRTYEMLDILQRKEEEVFVGDKGTSRMIENPIQQMFQPTLGQWSSLLGEISLCVFCNEKVQKITEESLSVGLMCPKCRVGDLVAGEEFEIWD